MHGGIEARRLLRDLFSHFEVKRCLDARLIRTLRALFFAGKLIFRHASWWQRLLHNETAHAVQRRLEFDGLTMVVLPIRMLK